MKLNQVNLELKGGNKNEKTVRNYACTSHDGYAGSL